MNADRTPEEIEASIERYRRMGQRGCLSPEFVAEMVDLEERQLRRALLPFKKARAWIGKKLSGNAGS